MICFTALISLHMRTAFLFFFFLKIFHRRRTSSQCPDTVRCCIFLAASSDTTLDDFSGLGAGLGAGLGFGVFAALLGYSLLPNIILPTRTLVAPTSICNTGEHMEHQKTLREHVRQYDVRYSHGIK